MPCRIDMDEYDLAEANAKLDRVTRLLCEAYAIIWAEGMAHSVSVDGANWRESHDEDDRRRRLAD